MGKPTGKTRRHIVKEYLLSQYRESSFDKNCGEYKCFEGFVLKYGKQFRRVIPIPTDVFHREGKECFRNAFSAIGGDKKRNYCEGYATIGTMVVPHAWVVNDKNEVIDPTWGDRGKDYYGVIFEFSYVFETFIRNFTTLSLIDDYENGFPLFKMTKEELFKKVINQ